MKNQNVHPLRRMIPATREETRIEHILAALAFASNLLDDKTHSQLVPIIPIEMRLGAKRVMERNEIKAQKATVTDALVSDSIYFVNIGKIDFYKEGTVRFVPDFPGLSYSIIKQLKTKLGAVESGKLYHMDVDALGGFDRLVSNVLDINAVTYKLEHVIVSDSKELIKHKHAGTYGDSGSMSVVITNVYTDSYTIESFKFLAKRDLHRDNVMLDYNV